MTRRWGTKTRSKRAGGCNGRSARLGAAVARVQVVDQRLQLPPLVRGVRHGRQAQRGRQQAVHHHVRVPERPGGRARGLQTRARPALTQPRTAMSAPAAGAAQAPAVRCRHGDSVRDHSRHSFLTMILEGRLQARPVSAEAAGRGPAGQTASTPAGAGHAGTRRIGQGRVGRGQARHVHEWTRQVCVGRRSQAPVYAPRRRTCNAAQVRACARRVRAGLSRVGLGTISAPADGRGEVCVQRRGQAVVRVLCRRGVAAAKVGRLGHAARGQDAQQRVEVRVARAHRRVQRRGQRLRGGGRRLGRARAGGLRARGALRGRPPGLCSAQPGEWLPGRLLQETSCPAALLFPAPPPMRSRCVRPDKQPNTSPLATLLQQICALLTSF